jgi:hypothetical protein
LACNAAYPNLSAEVAAVIAELDQRPVELPLVHPQTGRPISVNGDQMVLTIHNMLFATEGAVMLPALIHLAYLGEWDAIAQMVAASLPEDAPDAEWRIMNLTILCHEDWARTRPAETAQLSAGSYMGYEHVRRITVPEQICALIPRPQPAALYEPVTSSPVPVLIISNEADPQNPPENVAGAKDHYPNSLTLVAPGQGHGYSGFDCRDRIIADFIETGTTQGLNSDCLQLEPLPPFEVIE